ncbi:unnamed protein product [Meganyctiphanes norvegica]|uniref:Uncharacterized protein n=1 Tax=Meganyctiphanes norvegica TaxID=48144 RepID=A0AAV2PMI7_MEGNR
MFVLKIKELLRSIGKIENTDWNMMALDKKMQEEKLPPEPHEREKVPKWGRENYEDKLHNMERRLRENGEDEETIAKYRDIDSSLKRLEIKLREGSSLSPGLRGQNKVAGLANKLSTALENKEPEKVVLTRQPSRPVVPLPTNGSDLCHFCGNRVYLVERLSAEGKFFHRQCFKCDYCAANLRLGNYIYDREGHFGGKFFCVPHYGMSSRAARGKRKDDTDSTKENIVPPAKVPHTPRGQVMGEMGAAAAARAGGVAGVPTATLPAIITPPGVAQALAAGDNRGTTPERVEFENSVVEQSDEDEYLSEDEWTDRNFGASANELDESDGDESEYSDLSDEEAEGDDLGYLESEGKMTAAETRRLAESWQRRYSTDRLDDDEESELDSDNYSEEYGAEGDESHTATEGEADEDDEEDAEPLRRARELRRQELNIKHVPPPRKGGTSDSGSETEIASDEESEESDTQIDTDSEFDEDNKQSGFPKGIPTIVIDETQDNASHSPLPPKNMQVKENNNKLPQADQQSTVGHPRPEYIEQTVDLGKTVKTDEDIFNENREKGTEKSASLSNIHDHYKGGKDDAIARIEQIRRYINRNDSNISNDTLIAKQRGMQQNAKRNFLVGENTNLPKKSVSSADIGTKFKSFMDKISETQSMLKPAAQPSAQMQAFMNTPLTKTPLSSPSSPQLPNRSISLPQGEVCPKSFNVKGEMSVMSSVTDKEGIKNSNPSFPLVDVDVNTSSEDQTKAASTTTSNTSSPAVTTRQQHTKSANNYKSATESEVSKSDGSLSEVDNDSSTSQNDSDYDNVPSAHKVSSAQSSPPTIQINKENNITELERSSSKEIENDIVNQSEEIFKQIQSLATKDEEDMDEFGFTLKSHAGLENEAVETINRELVSVNAPRSLELINNAECGRIETVVDEEGVSVIFANDFCNISETNDGESDNANASELGVEVFSEHLSDFKNLNESDANESEVEELFNQLASDAINTNDAVHEPDQLSEMIDNSLGNKESIDNLVDKENIKFRKSTEQDKIEEKLERAKHMKNKSYTEPHVVIALSSDESTKMSKKDSSVNKENLVCDNLYNDLLREEIKNSEIIEKCDNLESIKFSIIEEKKNEENVRNIDSSKDSIIDIDKKSMKVCLVDHFNSPVGIKETSYDSNVNTLPEMNNIETKNISTNSSNHSSEEDLIISASLEINKFGNQVSVTEKVLSTSPASSECLIKDVLGVSVPSKSLVNSSLSASPTIDNHLIKDALEVPESSKNVSASTLSSPESRTETMASESEFLDWEPDHDTISAGDDLDMELHPELNINNLKEVKHKPIARIASIESLGDTNSEISAATPKSPKKLSTNLSSKLNPISSANSSETAVLTDLDGIEFMDTSESGSSPEDAPHRQQGYRKLGEVTPTTPVAPSVEDFTKAAGDGKLKSSDQSWSSSSTNTSDDDTKSSVQEVAEKNNNLSKVVPPKNIVESNENQVEDKVSRSNSEPPSLSEKLAKVNGTPRRDSLDDFASPKRYEGYIPRFKDRVSPFGFVRDSIDVVSKRNTTKTPLFTPSKQDIEERKQNENRLQQLTIVNNTNKISVSPNTAKKKIVESLKKGDKDGDLVREMVMNRIARKTPEKTSRRGSRTSSIGSRSSLLSPQSSQENLLDKTEKALELGKENVVIVSQSSTCKSNNELFNRSISESNGNNQIVNNTTFRIPLEKKELRLDALKSSLSKSTDSFLVEKNQKILDVENIPAIDNSTRQNSCIIDSVPFADDSQDEEVFEPAKNHMLVISSNAPVKPARKVSNSLQSVNGNESCILRSALPATPLTHPEQFKVNDHIPKKELFKVPTTPAPATPAQKTSLSKQLSTPSSVDREKLREEARQRAQSKTDTDLGISPPNLVDNLREKLRKGSFSENEENQKSGSEKDRKEKVLESPKKKDKEERVQELLAEHRQRDNSSPRDCNKKAQDWAEKDERVRERLEEYRQKRGAEAPNRNSDGVEMRKNSAQLVRRHTHRPSLLELESMQVFTVAGLAPQKSASATCIPTSMATNTYTTQPYLSATPPKSLPGAMPSSSNVSLASSPQTGTPASQNKSGQDSSTEKKTVKKSKDRERRRSLIQVFTGMFSKSGNEERKKSTGDVTDGTTEKKSNPFTGGSSSTSGPSSPVPIVVNTSPPVDSPRNKTTSASRSPATVKDKLSKLRLSRSKEKKKVNSDKNRSTSADMLDGGSTSDDTRVGHSLPTSPTRRSFSPFSAFIKTNTPPQASEESLSESEDQSCDRTPGGTLERGIQPPGSSSMARRSRAVQRAARQAELKRHRMAQEIQRKLEECEVKTRELEERGVNVEKSLRGENSGNNRDEAELMGDWFSMVHEKNALGRWEQELMVRAKELELEDRHVRLENELKRRMALSEHEKSREDIDREGNILAEMLSILEQKDALVNMLEEEKQRYIEEDRELEDIKMRKGINLTPSRRETGV